MRIYEKQAKRERATQRQRGQQVQPACSHVERQRQQAVLRRRAQGHALADTAGPDKDGVCAVGDVPVEGRQSTPGHGISAGRQAWLDAERHLPAVCREVDIGQVDPGVRGVGQREAAELRVEALVKPERDSCRRLGED